ncbi:MAG: phage virion morphogenesis protein [Caulobacter sp.]|nr:phage virion morphogenesis protein [Caulobacter sp.]
MKSLDDQVAELERAAGALLATLEAPARSALLRKMAHALRMSQARRIRQQQNPDGTPYVPRKPREGAPAASREIRFLYRKPGGVSRVADLKSWSGSKEQITGFDREAGDIRTFLKSRVERYLPAEGQADPGALEGQLRNKKGALRRRAAAMFQKIRTNANLKSGADAGGLWVGFTGRAARIARPHQYGLKDKVTLNGPEARYPQRQILGLSLDERQALLALLVNHVG